MKVHLLKPRLDGAGDPPSVKAQQKAMLDKKKKKGEKKAGEKLIEHDEE